ncbi:polysaccharide biosynthesis protein [Amylibacter sp.]|nr:polysaccharide biosynthesis protein [Amylibacter sp.]
MFLYNIHVWIVLISFIFINLVTLSLLGVYRAVVRHISTETIKHVGTGVCVASVLMYLISQFFVVDITFNILFVFSLLLFCLQLGARVSLRQIYINYIVTNKKSVAIYGAGIAGLQILNSISKGSDYLPKMFIDDDKNLVGRRIANLNIYSMVQAEKLFTKYNIDVLLIAIPNLPNHIKQNILTQLQKYPMQIKALPSLRDLVEGPIKINDLKALSINNLLERDTVKPDLELMSKNIKNKVVLITGAGGSIGSEISRQVIKCMPQKIILLDISEAALFLIQSELDALVQNQKIRLEVIPVLCSVQNSAQILKILKKLRVQTIFHAAAYKHVPLVEHNIIEAIRNNVFGTKSLGDMAIKSKVENFILISSDKAIRPTNFMGSTKRMAELICQDLALKKVTNFSMVRFGNVLGSSGSVIPTFQEQINKGGPITVTHKDITRFFMTIPEAAQLVLQASSMSTGNDIFILDMGSPVKIIDLAYKMIHLQGLRPYLENSIEDIKGDIAISITNLRPGEKLYEELLLGENSIKTLHPKIFKETLLGIETIEFNKLYNSLLEACDLDNIENIKTIFFHPKIGLNHSGVIVDKTL